MIASLECPFCGCAVTDLSEDTIQHPINTPCCMVGRSFYKDFWNTRAPQRQSNDRMLPELQDAIKPFLDFLEINDGDTLGSISKDAEIVATTSGSWTGSISIRWGDFRKLRSVVTDNLPKCKKCNHQFRHDENTAKCLYCGEVQ